MTAALALLPANQIDQAFQEIKTHALVNGVRLFIFFLHIFLSKLFLEIENIHK